jgi:hypothetical protein
LIGVVLAGVLDHCFWVVLSSLDDDLAEKVFWSFALVISAACCFLIAIRP